MQAAIVCIVIVLAKVPKTGHCFREKVEMNVHMIMCIYLMPGGKKEQTAFFAAYLVLKTNHITKFLKTSNIEPSQTRENPIEVNINLKDEREALENPR